MLLHHHSHIPLCPYIYMRPSHIHSHSTLHLASILFVKAFIRIHAPHNQVAERAVQLAAALMEDQGADPMLCRGGAEVIAAACCIGSESFALQQVGWEKELQLLLSTEHRALGGAGTRGLCKRLNHDCMQPCTA